MYIYFLFLGLLASAHADWKNLADQSFPRDHAVCYIKGKRLELTIRSAHKIIEPNDRDFGEYILYDLESKRQSLPISEKYSGTFKFFKGSSPACAKIHGYQIDDNSFVVLFLKENRPHRERLFLQFFDANTLQPKAVLETPYLATHVAPHGKGFRFISHSEKIDLEMGKVLIAGDQYIYQDPDFPISISYGQDGFKILPDQTFTIFPWKDFFKDENDFLKTVGWNSVNKTILNQIIYLAVNHSLKKRCILILDKKKNISGPEEWRCLQKM